MPSSADGAQDAPGLFSPLRIKGLTLRNRVVLSPMLTYRAVHGHLQPWHQVHLGKYAQGGVGLVFLESTKVDPRGCTTPSDLGLWKDDFIPAMRALTEVVRSEGAAVGIQLGHSGRKARNSLPWQGRKPLASHANLETGEDWQLIGPSPVPHYANGPVPDEMSRQDIADQVRMWRDAAIRADQSGFDVLEVHGAHGYLLHQFLSAAANTRSDEYGGSLANRCRFPLEVIRAVREVWPDGKPLFLRVSAVDESGGAIEETLEFVARAKEEGIDVVDCSTGGMSSESIVGQRPSLCYGYQVPHARRIRRDCGIQTMAVGLIVRPGHADEVIRRGDADLVAVGRELLFNPNWTLDAAIALGIDNPYAIVPPSYGYWLEKRAAMTISEQSL